MKVRFSSEITGISWEEVARLFELAPLGKKRDPDRIETAFRNSMLRVFAFADTRLVGVGRALSDGVWRAAIDDVAVLPEYQGQGIGSGIIRQLIQAADVDVVMLHAAPGKEAFYERFGFRKMKTAMAIMQFPEERQKSGFIE